MPALGAALAGRFRNLWIVCGVGLGIGALQGLAVHLGALESLPRTLQGGFDDALPLLVIVVALSFAGTTLPKRGALAQRRFPTAAPAPRPWVFGAVVVVALAVGWFGASPLRLSLVETTITAVLALSMVVSAGYIGQVSLAQVTIAGLAAYLLAGLTSGLHVPFPVAPVLAVLGAGALGFVVGIPALRIRGAQLMVVSLAFAVAINRLVLQNGELGRSAFGLTIEPARLFGMDLGTFGPGGFPAPRSVVLIVVVAELSFVAIANLRRGSTGRRWLAVRGNERARRRAVSTWSGPSCWPARWRSGWPASPGCSSPRTSRRCPTGSSTSTSHWPWSRWPTSVASPPSPELSSPACWPGRPGRALPRRGQRQAGRLTGVRGRGRCWCAWWRRAAWPASPTACASVWGAWHVRPEADEPVTDAVVADRVAGGIAP